MFEKIFLFFKHCFFSTKCFIKKFFKTYKSSLIANILFLITLTSSFTANIIIGSKSYDAQMEQIGNKISLLAKENNEKKVILNIKPKEYIDELKETYLTYYRTMEHNYYNSRLILNSKVNDCTYFSDFLAVNDNIPQSAIFPQVTSYKEHNVVLNGEEIKAYKLDVINLYLYNKVISSTLAPDQWCIVSDSYAHDIMKEYNYHDINEILNNDHYLTFTYTNYKNEKITTNLKIINFYYSELGVAPLISKTCNNFIISTQYFYGNALTKSIQGVALEIELGVSKYYNTNILKYFLEKMSIDTTEYTFSSGKKYNINNSVTNELYSIQYRRHILNQNNDNIFVIVLSIAILFVAIIYMSFVNKKSSSKFNLLITLLTILISLSISINITKLLNSLLYNGYGLITYFSISSLKLCYVSVIFLVFLSFIQYITHRENRGDINE